MDRLSGLAVYFISGKGKKDERSYDTELVEEFWKAENYK